MNLSYIHHWEPGASLQGPTLLLLHGTGGDEHDLVGLGRSLHPTANILSPRGKVSENGMARFFRRLAEGVFDLEDLAKRTQEIAAFVNEAAAAYGFDPKRVVALGYSNGANMAASLLLANTGVLSAAVLLHAMVPFEPAETPKLNGLPVLLTAGKQDAMMPEPMTRRLIALLKEGGAAVDEVWLPGGHGLSRPELEAVKNWIDQKGDAL